MAHHGSDLFGGLNEDKLKKMFNSTEFDQFKKSMPAEQFKKSMPAEQADKINEALKTNPMPGAFGATGNFPDGKLTETDEGEIMVGITSFEDRVVLNFGKAIHWIGLTKQQAKDIAAVLLKRAE